LTGETPSSAKMSPEQGFVPGHHARIANERALCILYSPIAHAMLLVCSYIAVELPIALLAG